MAFKKDSANLKSELKTTAVRHAVETKLMSAGARSPNFVLRALNLEKIQQSDDGSFTGIDEQIEALKKSDGYLFHTAETPVAVISDSANPVVGSIPDASVSAGPVVMQGFEPAAPHAQELDILFRR